MLEKLSKIYYVYHLWNILYLGMLNYWTSWFICQHDHICQYYITLKLSLSQTITRIYLIFSFFLTQHKIKTLLTGYSKVWDKIE